MLNCIDDVFILLKMKEEIENVLGRKIPLDFLSLSLSNFRL